MRVYNRVFLYLFFAITMNLSSSAFAKSNDEISLRSTVGNSSVSFFVSLDAGHSFYRGTWKWKDNGDNTVSLYPTSGGEIINPSQLSRKLVLKSPIQLIVRDKRGYLKHQQYFFALTYATYFSSKLATHKLKYDEDSIQFIVKSDWDLSILGEIQNNLANNSFSSPTQDTMKQNALIPTRSGLKAIYINQDKIGDGSYYIQAPFSEIISQYVSVGVGTNVISGNEAQEWIVTFDEKKNAYRIKHVVENKSLARNGSGKRNVFVWDSSTQFADQYWYFNKKSNGNYEIKSALTYSYYLNVDTNKNISVAPKRNNVFQEFRLDRIN